ncbi:GNAT family N-acetyltransferase [Metabacillus iocasae]|uniref:Ribosomal-protein-alanine N-acetyltransferase n=1 Tax=Priestia iocasae TaxID=2291674 RepID=A0ABS2QU61_9BACI|nr:GNAT family protein [Metabacillus iocasae]MBM7702833.1 ribosomal-protein-alanine N-acetyltransferase [Metabacillus iocasae]
MTFPILETKRLQLRELTLDDVDTLYDYFSNHDVTRYYGMSAFTGIYQAENLITHFEQMARDQKGIRWGIMLKEENELIGTIGFHSKSSLHKRAEVGYELHPAHWEQGYASEALDAVMIYGFAHWQLNRIGAVVFVENEASHRLLQKKGFQREGILREYMVQDDITHDAVSYSLLKKEWEQN